MTLAIIAPGFDAVSETFIRDHVTTIAPKNTVLVAKREASSSPFECPILRGVDPEVRRDSLLGHVKAFARTQWRNRVAMRLPCAQANRVTEFLRHYEVKASLVQYMNTGVLFEKPIRKAGTRFFVFAHAYDVSLLGQLDHWRNRYRRMLQTIDGVFTPSEFIANEVIALGASSNRVHVCHCGVDPEVFKPSVRESGRCLAVGRLVAKKAPDITIRAFASASRSFPNARLDIVGDGPMRSICEETAKRVGAERIVTFHGEQPNERVQELMCRASVFLQHSVTTPKGDTEGLPVAVLEAMFSGIPVISTRHSGIPDAVVEGETGFLVDEYDESDMAKYIAKLLRDPVLSKHFGNAGRQRALATFTQARAAEILRSVMDIECVSRVIYS